MAETNSEFMKKAKQTVDKGEIVYEIARAAERETSDNEKLLWAACQQLGDACDRLEQQQEIIDSSAGQLDQFTEHLEEKQKEIEGWEKRYEDTTGGMMKRQIGLIQELANLEVKIEQQQECIRELKEKIKNNS